MVKIKEKLKTKKKIFDNINNLYFYKNGHISTNISITFSINKFMISYI